MIKPLRDLYLISLNEEQNSVTKSGIIIDTSWQKLHHAVQDGIIESLPLSVTEPYPYKNNVDIKIGDKAYFHHFVHSEDNFILDGEKKLYKCPRYHLYCIVRRKTPKEVYDIMSKDDMVLRLKAERIKTKGKPDGVKIDLEELEKYTLSLPTEIIMLDDWLLASPILETEDDIIKTFGTLKLFTKAAPDKIEGMCKAEFVSKECEKQGIKPGDIIYFKKDADYEMKIEGGDYYRMKIANVVAVLRQGELLPIRDEIMIENTAKKELVTASGIILPRLRKGRQQTEVIFKIGDGDAEKEFRVGDYVSIFWYTGSGVNHKDKNYIFLRQEEIIGKFTN